MSDHPRLTISLSSPDNIDKKTVLSLFPRSWPLTHFGGIHLYDEEMNGIINDGSLAVWWFGDEAEGGESLTGGASDEVFVQTTLRACAARHEAAKAFNTVESRPKPIEVGGQTLSLPGSILDRSSLMFEAACVARIALRHSIDLSEAEQRLGGILADMGTAFPAEHICLLLRRAGRIEDAVEWSLEEEGRYEPVPPINRQYQKLFDEALERQVIAGRYTEVILRGDGETFIETLSKVTEAIQRVCGAGHSWKPLLHNLRCCPAFGGLSECGKLTVATETVSRAFVATAGGAFRLKIGYLLELAGARLECNIYELPENEQALELVHELDRFSRWHPWVQVITLESLHCYKLTRRLRELIGHGVPGKLGYTAVGQPSNDFQSPSAKLLVVYLDTPLELRRSRTEADGKSFDASKDEIKTSRGADKIRDIADLVVDNTGPFQDTCDEVYRVVSRFGI